MFGPKDKCSRSLVQSISCLLDFDMWVWHSKEETDERELARLNDWRSPVYDTKEKSVEIIEDKTSL